MASLAGKTALITGRSQSVDFSADQQHCILQKLKISLTGSTQGIGLGMLKGLAQAGANVVMHGLIPPEEAAARCRDMEKEYGVKVGQSAADVTQPQAIRCCQRSLAGLCQPYARLCLASRSSKLHKTHFDSGHGWCA